MLSPDVAAWNVTGPFEGTNVLPTNLQPLLCRTELRMRLRLRQWLRQRLWSCCMRTELRMRRWLCQCLCRSGLRRLLPSGFAGSVEGPPLLPSCVRKLWLRTDLRLRCRL